MYRHISLCALLVSVLLLTSIGAAETPDRVTILYDSFGKNPALTMDWGFAALIEYGGKRILFDTGNSAKIFEHNVKAAGAHLRNLDFVVISHRHADYTSSRSKSSARWEFNSSAIRRTSTRRHHSDRHCSRS